MGIHYFLFLLYVASNAIASSAEGKVNAGVCLFSVYKKYADANTAPKITKMPMTENCIYTSLLRVNYPCLKERVCK